MGSDKELPLHIVLMDAIKEMVFLVRTENDATFRYAFLNKAVSEHTGFGASTIGKTFEQAMPAEEAKHYRNLYGKAYETKQNVYYEDSYLSPAGEKRFSKTALTPILNSDGGCDFVVGIVADVTNETKAQLETEQTVEHLRENEARYSSLFEHNSDAVFTLDLAGTIQAGNQAVEQLSGQTIEQLTGRKLTDYLGLEAAQSLHLLTHSRGEGAPADTRCHFFHQTGERIGVLLKIVPIKVGSEKVGLYAILKDMRELDKLARLLVDSEEKFRLIAENVHDVIFLMDEYGKVSFASPSVEKVYGISPGAAKGKPGISFAQAEDVPEVLSKYDEALNKRKTVSLQFPVKHRQGHFVWSELSMTPVFDRSGELESMLAIARDITLQKERETQLHYFAYHDSLTGLPNRRFFTERVTEALAELKEQGRPFAVGLFDIDRFKSINDRFGHEAGDLVIKEFGRRLQGNIGLGNIAARLGGDEFIVLLTEIENDSEARTIYARIVSALEQPWTLYGRSFTVTASAGLSIVMECADPTVSNVLKDADTAMYEAKKSGGNALRIHDSQ